MKKKILTVLLTVGLCLPFVAQKAFASASSVNGNGTSNYGSYNYSFSVINEQFNAEFGLDGIGGVSISYPIAQGSSFNFTYNFKDTYTGYVQFTVTSNTGAAYRLDQCVWSVSGGYFNNSYLPSVTLSSTSKQFRVFVYNSTGFTFTIVSPNVNTFNPTSTSFTGYSFGSLTYSLSDVGDIPDLVSKFDLYIPGMSTSLSNIESDIDNLNSNISTLLQYTDGLESYVDGIEPYLNNLLQIDKIRAFPLWQQNIIMWCSRFGTFDFSGSLPGVYFDSSNNTGSWTAAKRLEIAADSTYSMIFYTTVNLNVSNLSIYTSGNYVTPSVARTTYLTVTGYPLYLIRFDFTNSSDTFTMFEPEFNTSFTMYPLFWGSADMIPEDVSLLLGVDYENTYTRLLKAINDGIGGTYDTRQYKQYDRTIDGLNDSMKDNFSNSQLNMQLELDNLTDFPGTFDMVDISYSINAVVTDMFEIVPDIKYIFVVGCLLLILGVFL